MNKIRSNVFFLPLVTNGLWWVFSLRTLNHKASANTRLERVLTFLVSSLPNKCQVFQMVKEASLSSSWTSLTRVLWRHLKENHSVSCLVFLLLWTIRKHLPCFIACITAINLVPKKDTEEWDEKGEKEGEEEVGRCVNIHLKSMWPLL